MVIEIFPPPVGCFSSSTYAKNTIVRDTASNCLNYYPSNFIAVYRRERKSICKRRELSCTAIVLRKTSENWIVTAWVDADHYKGHFVKSTFDKLIFLSIIDTYNRTSRYLCSFLTGIRDLTGVDRKLILYGLCVRASSPCMKIHSRLYARKKVGCAHIRRAREKKSCLNALGMHVCCVRCAWGAPRILLGIGKVRVYDTVARIDPITTVHQPARTSVVHMHK